MSATIKPTNQQISAIGTKPAFQAPFLQLDPATSQLLNQNYLSGNALLPRVGSNVVPTTPMPASTSYYNSASGTGMF